MSACMLCPRECGVDRSKHTGYCGAQDAPHVARAALHMWEEPYISGTRGSGAIFFCGCNLDCMFCQNYEINHNMAGEIADTQRLSYIMLGLERIGAHNINLVTPSVHVEPIISALERAKREGLTIPVVYNTNAYEKVDTLKRLEGLVDIYLPDIKYVSAAASAYCSGAKDYFEYASKALSEMFRQCGELTLDEAGIAVRGVAIRHLVLPGYIDETRRVLDHIKAEYPVSTYISLMSQYYPCHRATEAPLNRRLTKREYDNAVDYCCMLGFTNVFIQERSSAKSEFTPDFSGYCQSDYE